ncbi:ABC transporter permease [Salipaludibacillus sp. CF4.18]|uniref:ABC transporter permease n=1 Tax=Salipaludibacillus sp. CF4.18 TaxID=3373081 RepID=UPI003EE70905
MKKGFALYKQRIKMIPLPALFFVMIFLVAGGGFAAVSIADWVKGNEIISPFQVAIVDNEDSFETGIIRKQLQESEATKELITYIHTSQEEARYLLNSDQVVATVLIPETFTDDLRTGRNTPLEVELQESFSLERELFLELIYAATDLVNAAQTAVNTVHYYLSEWDVEAEEKSKITNEAIIHFSLEAFNRSQLITQSEIEATGSYSVEKYYVSSFFIILLYIFPALLSPVTQLSLNKSIVERFISLNVGYLPIVISSFILFFIFCAGVSTIVLSGLILMGILEISWGLIAVTSLFVLFFASLFTFFSFLPVRPLQEQAIVCIIGIILFIIGGLIVPISFLPSWLSDIHRFTPFHWLHQLFLLGAFDQNFTKELYVSFVLFFSLSFLLLAAAVGMAKKKVI